ncbi:hypothetical protein ACHAWO_007408 [Cyclotella atomus]|uniref:Uncharacterized protein n=1 Tax=Cyclotella atomus TaxID=382360 RepID=A0ABD3QFC5_9STRA
MATTIGNICHILPCSINEDMTAHTARYFHPTDLKSESTDVDASGVKIMAAQFRGRGLLCVADDDVPRTAGSSKLTVSALPEGVKGLALAPSTSHVAKKSDGDATRSLKVVETFTEVYNWQHEYDVDKVRRSVNDGGHDKVGLKAALGWCDIAQAVHDPIPLPP